MVRLILVVAVLLLTACASATVPGSVGDPAAGDRLAALKEFAVQDAKDALAIATKGNDKPAVQCLTYLVPKIEALAALQPPGAAQPQGALTIFESLRVAIHGPDTGQGFLADLDLNCAALRTSIEIDVAKGAVLGASIAGSGGATAPGAAAKVLPILMRLLRPAG